MRLSTTYKLTKQGNKFVVDWWTEDNLDQGYASEEAEAQYSFNTIGEAYSFIRGNNINQQPITHSWYGWLYHQPVGVFIDGKLLPFES